MVLYVIQDNSTYTEVHFDALWAWLGKHLSAKNNGVFFKQDCLFYIMPQRGFKYTVNGFFLDWYSM